ncbi:acyl carrier protein [Flexivirga oryzae]|uniref:Acyl carrier protein n=1 Tax=Flexivirga oryzae TaxID=1794944 RepID=A0A839NAL3_9MICO|nr:acyl carrier protein [Flexivirga oryzae]MBB2893253.1 acyl carrier protein [Flexivirga oryzae]
MSAVPMTSTTPRVTDFLVTAVSQLVGAEVSRDDNIFDIGVESLMLVDLKEQILDEFGVSVKFSDFFTNFEIDSLASLIAERAEDVR